MKGFSAFLGAIAALAASAASSQVGESMNHMIRFNHYYARSRSIGGSRMAHIRAARKARNVRRSRAAKKG